MNKTETKSTVLLKYHLKALKLPTMTAYERNSLIVTTNLPFENWTEVLGSERLNHTP